MKQGDKVMWIKDKPTQKDWTGVVLKVYPETNEVAVEWRRVDGGGKLTVSLQPFAKCTPVTADQAAK